MGEQTLWDKICHFIFHRRYYVEDYNGEGRMFYPKWQNVIFGLASQYKWNFHARGFSMNLVCFNTKQEAIDWLIYEDVDQYRFEVPRDTFVERIR